jgi:SAM-dependent methyltransferase
MPYADVETDPDLKRHFEPDLFRYLEDQIFDSVYPPHVRAHSEIHWTPIPVAKLAAKFLVTSSATRVLDIGSGPGKFCAIGAINTDGHFTGVEQRSSLFRAAERMRRLYGVSRVNFVHANISKIPFEDFDAFYLFNPFYEHLSERSRIDNKVYFEPTLYEEYSSQVRDKLAMQSIGSRVVTYWTDDEIVPDSFDCVETGWANQLKMWIKNR